jgi:Fic/DOC family N-terminal
VERSDTGRYVTSVAGSEEVRAFVPAPLPPVPALELIGGVRNSLDQGLLALGRLDGAAGTLPDAHLLLYTYVRKEAVLSSQGSCVKQPAARGDGSSPTCAISMR